MFSEDGLLIDIEILKTAYFPQKFLFSNFEDYRNDYRKIANQMQNLEQIERHNLICSIKGIEDWETIWP